jgi:isoleucyl-tRNA synthetase
VTHRKAVHAVRDQVASRDRQFGDPLPNWTSKTVQAEVPEFLYVSLEAYPKPKPNTHAKITDLLLLEHGGG